MNPAFFMSYQMFESQHVWCDAFPIGQAILRSGARLRKPEVPHVFKARIQQKWRSQRPRHCLPMTAQWNVP